VSKKDPAARDFWQGRRVFVTGHTGFKGAWLWLWLRALGARLAGYALAPVTVPSLWEIVRAGAGAEESSIIADVRDPARLRAALGPWSVSGPALVVGAAALADSAWLEGNAASLECSARRLDALLAAAGFAIIGGAGLFRLAEHDDAANWFEQLCQAGILTRRFVERPKWLRFGLPAAPRDWERLALALRLRPDVER